MAKIMAWVTSNAGTATVGMEVGGAELHVVSQA